MNINNSVKHRYINVAYTNCTVPPPPAIGTEIFTSAPLDGTLIGTNMFLEGH